MLADSDSGSQKWGDGLIDRDSGSGRCELIDSDNGSGRWARG